MKTQRKHGFTIVELVVVIAVIAILAAVLIPTFVSIIKKANDSAYVQERQSQRIDDIAQKLDNETWVSWEDVEVKLAEEISKLPTTSEDDIKGAIEKALLEYESAHQQSNTGVTADQVEKIVSEATKGQLTSAQIEALVANAVSKVSGTSGVTTAQVQAIVNQALAGVSASGTGLSASQVNTLINSALSSSDLAKKSEIASAISAALANFDMLSRQDVEAIVSEAIANTTSDEKYIYVFASRSDLTSGKTYYVANVPASASVVHLSGTEKIDTIIINDANADVFIDSEVKELIIEKTAMASTHICAKVESVVVNSGHVEIESSAKVTTVTAAPSTNATVKVTVEGEVTTLNAEYQDHGTGTNDTIIVVDKTDSATVSIVASTELEASGTTTTNVTIESKNEEVVNNSTLPESVVVNVTVETESGETEYVADKTGKVEANGDYVAKIGSTGYETLQAAINAAQSGETVVLLKDVTITQNGSSSRIPISKSMTLDGNNNTITINARGFGVGMNATSKIDVTFKNITIINSQSGGRCIDTRGNLASLTLDTVTLKTTSSAGYVQPLTIGGNQSDIVPITIKNSLIQTSDDGRYGYAIITFNPVNMEISDSTIKGWACIYAKGPDGSAGSSGSNFSIDNTHLVSTNYYAGETNAFAIIKMEEAGVQVKAILRGCTFDIDGVNNTQYIVSFRDTEQNPVSGCVVAIGPGNIINLKNYAEFDNGTSSGSVLYITGGTFNVDPTGHLVDGYVARDNGNGTWTVVPDTVNSVGPVGGESVEEGGEF